MKILIVHNYYQQAGGERVSVEAQISILKAHGYEVILYAENSKVIDEYNWRQKIDFFPNTIFSIKTFRNISRLIQKEQPDIAHVHNVFPLISPSIYWALKKHSVPIVQTIYNFRFLCPNGLLYTHGTVCERCIHGNTLPAVRFNCYRNSRLLSGLYAFTIGFHRLIGTFSLIENFVTPAEFTAKKLAEGGIAPLRKFSTIPYILPGSLPPAGKFNQRDRYIVFIGRLSSEKGIWTLLQAIAGLEEIKVKILGDGPLAQQINEYIHENLLENVEQIGFVSGETKWTYLRHAMASVVPSEWYENSPFTVLESLAVGTPVIASGIGSLPEIVKHQETGLLFSVGDYLDLREKLLWLWTHPEEAIKMGETGRHLIETNYSPEGYSDRLFKLYKSLKKN